MHNLLEGQLEKCHQGDGKRGDLNIKALCSLTTECGILWSTPTQWSFRGKCTTTPVGSVALLLLPGGVPSLGSYFSAWGLVLHSRLGQFSFSPTHQSLIGVPSYFRVLCAQSYPSFPGTALAPEALASSNLLEQNQIPSQIQKAMK